MNKSKKLFIALAIFCALAIGFLIGISVESPRLNIHDLSGTIGKVNNYRNTKVTEADIELKNELLADTLKLKKVKNYMNVNYVRSIELVRNIDFAVNTVNANQAFKTSYEKEIAALKSYGTYLGTARKDLLVAVAACQSVEKVDPLLLRGSIAQANNVIAQISYRNKAILDFITVMDSFIQKNGINNNLELNKAHDRLMYNQIGMSILTKDKVMLKFFDQKKLFCNNLESTNPSNYKENIQKDVEQLGWKDADQLSIQGILYSSGKLNDFTQNCMDTENLKMISYDMEKLGIMVADVEKLGAFNDGEELGCSWDSEQLGGGLAWDSEQLGFTGGGF